MPPQKRIKSTVVFSIIPALIPYFFVQQRGRIGRFLLPFFASQSKGEGDHWRHKFELLPPQLPTPLIVCYFGAAFECSIWKRYIHEVAPAHPNSFIHHFSADSALLAVVGTVLDVGQWSGGTNNCVCRSATACVSDWGVNGI